jgi:hypothetical protein
MTIQIGTTFNNSSNLWRPTSTGCPNHSNLHKYSAFFLTVAIGNCMVKLIPAVNFCSDENIQTIFGTKLKDFLNYRIDYNSIS